MSGTSGGKTLLDKPQATIGAQDILTVGYPSKYGMMRNQGSLERLFKFLKWRQRFVVISRGCIYVFKDEFSRSPSKAYSMQVFDRCSRHETSPNIRWAFMVHSNIEETGYKSLLFSCTSDAIRKEWMKAIKEEMMKVHKVTSETTEDLDEYIYIEKPVKSSTASGRRPVPLPTHDEEELEEIEEDGNDADKQEDYSTIDEAKMGEQAKSAGKMRASKPTFKVEIPKTTESNKSAKQTGKVTKKKVPSPTPIHKSPSHPVSPSSTSRVSFEYKGTDRSEIEVLLVQRPEGTFLVRKSRSDNKEVLSVNIDGALKEFKVYEKEGQFTIDHKDIFASVEDLVQNYHIHNLPNKDKKLFRAFSLTDPGYVNVTGD